MALTFSNEKTNLILPVKRKQLGLHSDQIEPFDVACFASIGHAASFPVGAVSHKRLQPPRLIMPDAQHFEIFLQPQDWLRNHFRSTGCRDKEK
jgi:hypothetical protein